MEVLARGPEPAAGGDVPHPSEAFSDRVESSISRGELRRRIGMLLKEMETWKAPAGSRPEYVFDRPAAAAEDSFYATIDKGMARRLLAFNNRNRDIDRANVERYARLLLDGQWKVTSQAVSFTVSGDLGNGQHRLIGVYLTGVPARVNVAVGLPDDSIFAEDRAAVRTLGHDLQLDGQADDLHQAQRQVLQAVVRIVHHLDQGRLPWLNRPKPTVWDARVTLDRHPTLKPAIRDYYTRACGAGLPPGPTCAFLGLFLEANPDLGGRFAEKLVSWDSLSEGDPVKTLVRSCMREGSKYHAAKRNAFMCRMVRAWNNVVAGRTATSLNGTLNEGKFPRIEGLKYDLGGRLKPRR